MAAGGAGGRRLIVATNADLSDAAAVRAALARVQLDALVDDVVSSHDVGVRKPDPAFFRAALARAGAPGEPVTAADAVMVGDSFANDVAGAKAAGLRAVWLDTGARPGVPERAAPAAAAPGGSGRRLTLAGPRTIAQPVVPDAVIASMADLPAAIGQLERQPRRRRANRRLPAAPWVEPPAPRTQPPHAT